MVIFIATPSFAQRGNHRTCGFFAGEILLPRDEVAISGGAFKRGWELIPPKTSQGAMLRIAGPACLRVNNSFAVRDALNQGLGIGQLTLLVAVDDVSSGKLVCVLPQWQFAPVSVQAVYPSHRYLSPKVRTFIDLALTRFPQAASEARKATAQSGRE